MSVVLAFDLLVCKLLILSLLVNISSFGNLKPFVV